MWENERAWVSVCYCSCQIKKRKSRRKATKKKSCSTAVRRHCRRSKRWTLSCEIQQTMIPVQVSSWIPLSETFHGYNPREKKSPNTIPKRVSAAWQTTKSTSYLWPQHGFWVSLWGFLHSCSRRSLLAKVCGHMSGSVQSQVIRIACISSLFILLMATKVHLFHVNIYTTVQNRAFAWTLSWNAIRKRFMPVWPTSPGLPGSLFFNVTCT